jgi:hypothetical protein
MTCCAVGDCGQASCRVCFWGRQPQPVTARQRKEYARLKALGAKTPRGGTDDHRTLDGLERTRGAT